MTLLALVEETSVDISGHNTAVVVAVILFWAVCVFLLAHECSCEKCEHCRRRRKDRNDENDKRFG